MVSLAYFMNAIFTFQYSDKACNESQYHIYAHRATSDRAII